MRRILKGLVPDVAFALCRRAANKWPNRRGNAVKRGRASDISAMARAILPLPSSNGWTVTNQKCAIAALSTGSVVGGVLNHWMNRLISPCNRSAVGASK